MIARQFNRLPRNEFAYERRRDNIAKAVDEQSCCGGRVVDGSVKGAEPLTQHDDELVWADALELRHRIKNMMAVISSLCRQTMRQSQTKEEFERNFTARLSAYSKSIDLLIADNWVGLDIDDLVRSQLATFGIIDGCQIEAAGPRLRLSEHAAHGLGLALHELATNAAKYGALSVPDGRVHITWSVFQTDTGQRFGLRWEEVGGPIVVPPTRRGFGCWIIQNLSSLEMSGRADYEFLSEGVRWFMDAPVSSALVPLEPEGSTTAASL